MKTFSALTSAIILFVCQQVCAQNNFEQGYVVLTSGDTLKGSIYNADWRINPKSIEFKTSSGVSSTYTPAEIKWIHLAESNEDFRGVSMNIDKSPTQPDHVTEESHLLSQFESLFLRVLANGQPSLLYAFDFKHHFFYEKNGEVTELLYPAKLTKAKNPFDTDANTQTQKLDDKYRKSGNVSVLTRQEKYKFQLINLFSDCAKMVPDLQKATYTEKSLRNVFIDYYKCKSIYNPAMEKKIAAPLSEFGVIAGASQSTQSIQADGSAFSHLEAKGSKSINPAFGIYFQITSPRNRKKFAFYSELLFQQYKISSQSETQNIAYRTVYDNNFNIKNLNANLGGRYHFSSGKVRPFVALGVGAIYSLQVEAFTIDSKIRLNESQPYDQSRDEYHSRNFQFGFWAGAGVTRERFGLEARITKTNGWSDVPAIAASVSHVNFLLAYRLSKAKD